MVSTSCQRNGRKSPNRYRSTDWSIVHARWLQPGPLRGHGSLRFPEYTHSSIPSWLVQLFLHGSKLWPTNNAVSRWTNIQRVNTCIGIAWQYDRLLLHPFNSLYSRTTWVSRYQKGKPVWIKMRQEMMGFWDGSGISWTICKQPAPCSRQITTPTPHHSIFTGQMLFTTPNQQCLKALKAYGLNTHV